MVPKFWKTILYFLNKLTIELPSNAEILLPGIFPRQLKIYVHTKSKYL